MVRGMLRSVAGVLLAVSAATAHAEILIGAAAPLTGDNSWYGEHVESAVGMAVAELNEAGGILGQTVRAITVDDYCRGDQAVAAAQSLVAAGVVFVVGHPCSGAAIPASKVYEQAGVLMIASTASNPKLTDEGGPNVFRMVGRDDQQGRIAGDYLADRHGGAEIAILHDGEAYGQGLAEQTKRQLNKHGIQEVVFEPITPGERDYTDVLSKMKSAGVDVLYYGGYSTEAGLMIRQARDLGYDVQLISGDGLSTEQFWLVAGPAGEGVLFTSFPDPSSSPEAAEVVRRFRAQNFEPGRDTLYTYASMQAWAQAVEAAGTLELDAVLKALRGRTFDTVLGTIGFDEKGDVTGPDTFVWYIWKDGNYGPFLSE